MESVNVVERSNVTSEAKRIPAVLYGKSLGSKSIFVLAGQQAAKRWHAGSKFQLQFGKETFRGTLEEVQTNAVGSQVQHLSFHVVGADEVTKVELPVIATHTDEASKAGNVTVMLQHVMVKAKLRDLPEHIEVSAAGMELNDTRTLADVTLPAGVEFAHANWKEQVVLVCKAVKVRDEATTTEATTEATTETKAA